MPISGVTGGIQPGISLETGPYKTGYQVRFLEDTARAITINGEEVTRPIQIHLWYPAKASTKDSMTLDDYVDYRDRKFDTDQSGFEGIQQKHWTFYDRLLGWGVSKEDLRAYLRRNYLAVENADYHTEKFPLVVYAPGLNSTPIENLELLEYLASHGYVIISSVPVGHQRLNMEMTVAEFEAQAKDMLFLVDHAQTIDMVDKEKTALMGFSLGGGSAALADMIDERIDARLGIDSSTRYPRGYSVLTQSQYYDISKADRPYIFFESKLPQPNWGPFPDSTFHHYRKLKNVDKYHLKFPKMRHIRFMSQNVNLLPPQPARNEENRNDLVRSYEIMATYVLRFLDFYLNDSGKNIEDLPVRESDQKLYSFESSTPRT